VLNKEPAAAEYLITNYLIIIVNTIAAAKLQIYNFTLLKFKCHICQLKGL